MCYFLVFYPVLFWNVENSPKKKEKRKPINEQALLIVTVCYFWVQLLLNMVLGPTAMLIAKQYVSAKPDNKN